MTKDNKTKSKISKKESKKDSKKEIIKKNKKIDEKKRVRKNNNSDDDPDEDDDDYYDDDDSDSYISDSDYDMDISDDDEMDILEYRKFISKIFPSKHMNNKVKAGEKLKKVLKENDENEEDEDEEDENNVKNGKNKSSSKKTSKKMNKKMNTKMNIKNKKFKNVNKNKKKEKSESENSLSESELSDSESDDYEDYDEEDDKLNSKSGNFNIIFTIGQSAEDDDDEWEDFDDEDYEEEYDDELTEDEDESVSTDESDHEDDENDENDDEEDKIVSKKSKNKDKDKKSKKIEKSDKKSKKIEKSGKKSEKENDENISLEINDTQEVKNETNETKETNNETGKETKNELIKSDDDVLLQLKNIQHKNKNNKAIQDCIEIYEDKIKENKKKQEKKQVKQKEKNGRIFKRVMRDKNTMNDFAFFEKLEIEQQKKIIKEVREINKISRIEKPYRITLLESTIPAIFKASAMKKIASLRYMEPGSGEYYKIKNWVDTFMRIPFNKFQTLPVTIENGVEACHEFMENAQKTLDNAVYGLNDAKMQIMQMLGQLVTNPQAIGTAIAIKGPMGTGKCHGIDTPILMYDGSIKMVQDIIVGDVIMGDDSQPRNVLSLGRGVDDLYEVIPSKGEKYVVNSEHILCLKQSGIGCIKLIKNVSGSISYKTIRLNNKTCRLEHKNYSNIDDAKNYLQNFEEEENIIEISIKDYLNLPKEITKNWLKGYRVGVEFPHKPVLFDPYIIGLWLGDSASSKTQITNQDSRILHYLMTELPKMNLELRYISNYDYNIRSNTNNRDNSFLKTLRYYNLINNKHIPNDYKINDRNTRLQILAGIIDADGSYSVKDKCFYIIQISNRISDDIIYICRSLGFAAYKKENVKSSIYKNEKREGIYHHICIFGENLNEIPTKCIIKQATEVNQFKNALVTGIKIQYKGVGNYYGFELDDNHRYLLGDFTVTHNTSLVKEGISKILNRPFSFIALGGATDSSFLEGHSYTYEGSVWGKIVQILIDSQCMNPVIYFDELDKISDTPKGEEIAGILTHLTDTSQNSQFHDKYFAEIDFDLSKCLFIFSYNDETKVNPILRDRMYKIQTKGYDKKEKTIISNNYLLPKIREQVKFTYEDIIIPDESIHYIIENHCLKEDGVRNLKRCLEIIYTKLNLYRLMKPGTNLFEQEMSLKVEFPMTVTNEIIDKLIKKDNDDISKSLYGLYV